MSELPTINRCVLMVMPKKPYWGWANSLQSTYAIIEPDDSLQPSSYLLPDFDDEEDVKNALPFPWFISFDLVAESL